MGESSPTVDIIERAETVLAVWGSLPTKTILRRKRGVTIFTQGFQGYSRQTKHMLK